MIFYRDTGSNTDFDADLVNRLNPNTMYINHLKNLYILKFLELKSDKFDERTQAKKEIEICNRKLKFWGRKINNKKFVDEKTKELKAIWNNI